MNGIKIKLVVPVVGNSNHDFLMESLNKIKQPSTELTLVNVKGGVKTLVSDYDAAIAAPYTLTEVESAGREGFDAALILCCTDPVINAAKEISSVLVVGILEAAICTACALGKKFSMLTVMPETVGSKYDRLKDMEMVDRCASVIPLGIPALELRNDRGRLIKVLTQKAKLAVERDHADTIILTCLGMSSEANELRQTIGIPVIEPLVCGVKWCEMLFTMGFSQSRKAFPIAR